MKPPYVPPSPTLTAFNCSYCHAYSNQIGAELYGDFMRSFRQVGSNDIFFTVTRCSHCGSDTIWLGDKMIYPVTAEAEPPNPDMPDDIKADYDEASSILSQSPRGAAALLRLALQKLCKHLGQPGSNLNNDIGALVANGLPSQVQQSLDIVRVVGNEAVHPGVIDLNDNREIANALFKLVNLICTKMITEPKEINEIYQSLPENKRDAISERDAE